MRSSYYQFHCMSLRYNQLSNCKYHLQHRLHVHKKICILLQVYCYNNKQERIINITILYHFKMY